jgi:hypothetical protein
MKYEIYGIKDQKKTYRWNKNGVFPSNLNCKQYHKIVETQNAMSQKNS